MWRVIALTLAVAGICGAQEGTRVFIAQCQQCHDPNSEAHGPLPEAMAEMPWRDILASLETGSMKAFGDSLSQQERMAVARFLGREGPVDLPEMTGHCDANAQPQATDAAWNGWGADNFNTRFQPEQSGGLTAGHLPSLELKWAFGFPNAVTAYSQPTVAGGRVYTGSNDGAVYALDARTGCIYWTFLAKAMVRSSIVIGPGPRAYFGDLESNFYALNAETGELAWRKKLDDQAFTRITGTPKLHDGRLYVPITSQEENAGANPWYSCCTFRGNLQALNAEDGSLIWKTYTTPEPAPTWKSGTGVQYYGPSGATIWSSPTIDEERGLVYVATGNGYSDPNIETADAIVAMDMKTGAIRWSKQTVRDMFNWGCAGRSGSTANCPENAGRDVDFGASPILLDAGNGRQLLVAGQKTAEVHAFDPDNQGEIVWTTSIGRGGPGGGIQWGIAAGEGLVFAPLGEAVRGEPEKGGGLFAFNPATGEIVWQTPAPLPSCLGQRGCSTAQKAPPTVIPGAVFSPSMDGHIRAYDTQTGEIIWDFDAVREFETVNGIPAKGGSFSSTGVTVAGGMMYVNSGYSSMPGNVLLAFGVE